MFETQRLVNNFPKDLKIREDASSLGFKLFSVMGDINTQFYADLIRLKSDFKLKSSNTDYINSIYKWDISEFSFNYYDDFGNKNPIIPNVYGDSVLLDYKKDFESFQFALPSDVEYKDKIYNYDSIIYSSNINVESTISDIKNPNYIYIELSDVEEYSYVLDSSKPRSISYIGNIELVGEDFYGNELKEIILLTSDGVYISQNIYTKLNSFSLNNIYGSDGIITIKTLDFNLIQYKSTYYDYVSSSTNDILYKDFDSNFFYLKKYIFPLLDNKRINSDQENIMGMSLKDTNGNDVNIKDISFIPSTEKLVVLSEDNKLLFFNSFLPEIMSKPKNERTDNILVTIELLTNYFTLNETYKGYIYQRNINDRVKTCEIKLIDPNNSEFYLNSDLEFTTDYNLFSGENAEWAGDSFPDLFIEFNLDTIGQWELVITVESFSGKEYIDVTNLFVPSLTATKEIQLESNYELVSYSFDGYIYLYDGVDIDIYNPIYNLCYIDTYNMVIYTSEPYDNLEVIYE